MATTVSVSQSFSSECAFVCASANAGRTREIAQHNFFMTLCLLYERSGFCGAGHEFSLVTQRGFAGDQFKIFIETGEIIKSALVTQLFYTEVIFDQELAGVADAQFEEEAGVRLPGPGFEEAAEGIGADIGHGGDLFQLDGAPEMTEAVFIDKVDADVFGFTKAVFEADGGQRMHLVG